MESGCINVSLFASPSWDPRIFKRGWLKREEMLVAGLLTGAAGLWESVRARNENLGMVCGLAPVSKWVILKVTAGLRMTILNF